MNGEHVGVVIGRTVAAMDGREHRRHRALVAPAMARRVFRGPFRHTIEDLAHGLIDGFVERGRADLVSAFTFGYPLRVFTRILDIPTEDADRVHRQAVDMVLVRKSPVKGLEAAAALADYFAPLIAERRARPGEDLISTLATAEVEGERLDDTDIVSFLRLLVLAGAETTYHLLGTTLYALLTHPEQLAELLADRSLIQNALDEALRWESPVQLVWRRTTRDAELGGRSIPAGSHVVLAIGSANRSDEVFSDPDRFDLHRDASTHLAFGQGRPNARDQNRDPTTTTWGSRTTTRASSSARTPASSTASCDTRPTRAVAASWPSRSGPDAPPGWAPC